MLWTNHCRRLAPLSWQQQLLLLLLLLQYDR